MYADRAYDLQRHRQELPGWVLYLEGCTDLSILQAFGSRLDHPAKEALAKPYVRYVGNQPKQARNRIWGRW